jgi:hypothetical protein
MKKYTSNGVGFAFIAKNITIIFSGIGASGNSKTCRDPSLGIDLPIYVNQIPIHLMTESLEITVMQKNNILHAFSKSAVYSYISATYNVLYKKQQ